MVAGVWFRTIKIVETTEFGDEPFIWPLFAKLDDDALYYALNDPNQIIERAFTTGLSEKAAQAKSALTFAYHQVYQSEAPSKASWFYAPGGAHGNLVVQENTIKIPESLGHFTGLMKREVTQAQARLMGIAVILEEQEFPSDDEIIQSYADFSAQIHDALVVALIDQFEGMEQNEAYLQAHPPLIDSEILTGSSAEIEAAIEAAIEDQILQKLGDSLGVDVYIGCKVTIRSGVELVTDDTSTFCKTLNVPSGGEYQVCGTVTGVAVPASRHLRDFKQASTPSAYGIDGFQHIFYHDSNDRVTELWFEGKTKIWRRKDLTLAVNPDAETDSSVDLQLHPTSFWHPSDGSQHVQFSSKWTRYERSWVVEFRESGGTWVKKQLDSPVAPASSPKGIIRGDGYCILYVGTDRHLHAFELSAASGILSLTDVTPGHKQRLPYNAIPGAPGAYVTVGTRLEAFYHDPQGLIKWLVSDEPGLWKEEEFNLPDISVPPTAASALSAFYNASDQTSYVVYRGVDRFLHLLSRGFGVGWKYETLSHMVAGNPIVGGAPFGFVWPYDNGIHIFFRGENARIYDIYESGGGWEIKDINAAAKASSAQSLSDPAAWFWPTDNGMHIAFAGFDNRLHEFVAVPGKEWVVYDLFSALGI
jgi:hypothetical protein